MNEIIIGKHLNEFQRLSVVKTKDFDWQKDITTRMPYEYYWYLLEKISKTESFIKNQGNIYDITYSLLSSHKDEFLIDKTISIDQTKIVVTGEKHNMVLNVVNDAIAGNNSIAVAAPFHFASAGKNGSAIAGMYGTASAGAGGSIQIYSDGAFHQQLSKIGFIGQDGLIPGVEYMLNDTQNFCVAERFLLENGFSFFFKHATEDQIYKIIDACPVSILNEDRLYNGLTKTQNKLIKSYVDAKILGS